ncbi:MAG: hypothetical protein JNM22_16670 [Saprospiraceae bacterium]|nr:hypothetical protein [Saprospiraceae bacterium]
MHQLFTSTIICIVLVCGLSNWKPGYCVEMSCAKKVQTHCSTEAPCRDVCSDNNDCSRDKDDCSDCCCVCRVICCYYLAPEFDYRLRLPEEESVSKPIVQEQFYRHSYNPFIWRPPARYMEQNG